MKIKHVASTFKGTSNSDPYIFQNFRKDACSFFAFFFLCKFVFFSFISDDVPYNPTPNSTNI